MITRKKKWLVMATLWLFSLGIGYADKLPWTFNDNRVDGYSIDLVSIDPSPGHKLIAGSEVAISASVKYSMTIAQHGKIILVFQDEKNRSVKQGDSQTFRDVTDSSGALTLSAKITVPTDAKELRLFIPLVPDGLKETDGEIVVRWPIKKK